MTLLLEDGGGDRAAKVEMKVRASLPVQVGCPFLGFGGDGFRKPLAFGGVFGFGGGGLRCGALWFPGAFAHCLVRGTGEVER